MDSTVVTDNWKMNECPLGSQIKEQAMESGENLSLLTGLRKTNAGSVKHKEKNNKKRTCYAILSFSANHIIMLTSLSFSAKIISASPLFDSAS